MKSLRLHKARLHRLPVKQVAHGVARHGERLARDLFDTYHPQVLVLDNPVYPGSRRSLHLPKMTAAITQLAEREGIEVVRYTQQEVNATLAPAGGPVTKATLCHALATRYPLLTPFLPRRARRGDGPEPLYTNLFMAVALGLAWGRQHLTRKR